MTFAGWGRRAGFVTLEPPATISIPNGLRQRMSRLQNIGSLADFQRNAKAHIKRLKRSGKPQVLTINGEAELVVQDAASYQKLLDDLEYAQAVAGISRGLKSLKRGEGRPMRQALEVLGRGHDIDLRRA